MPLADTLLRMAEHPRLSLPKWSQQILEEVSRNLSSKWDMPAEKVERRENALRSHFPEAMVDGMGPLVDLMSNHPGDRHVLAAAVKCNAELIVTYNRRHFPPESLEQWQVEVQGPSTFLRGLYDLEPGLFMQKVHAQADAIGMRLPRLLSALAKNTPGFVEYLCEETGIELEPGP
jgi:predicted nucleic acid-binding protein